MEKENDGKPAVAPAKKKKTRSWEMEKSIAKKVVWAAVILLALAWLDMSTHFFASIKEEMTAKRKWQAVFLNNNQIYFGHLSRFGINYWKLSDVRYIQTTKVPVAPPPSDAKPGDKKSETPQPPQEETRNTIVKMTGDLHGPEDAMFIPVSNILFWQNLRADSEVVRAINTPPTPQQK